MIDSYAGITRIRFKGSEKLHLSHRKRFRHPIYSVYLFIILFYSVYVNIFTNKNGNRIMLWVGKDVFRFCAENRVREILTNRSMWGRSS